MTNRPLRHRIGKALAPLARAFGFEAGGTGPRWPQGSTMPAPATAHAMARGPVAARAQWAAGNTAPGRAIALAWGANLIADGPSLRSTRPEVLPAWTAAWSALDADGLGDLAAILARAARSLVVTGEALILFGADADTGALRLRLIPSEQLDASTSRDLGGGAVIVNGVEFDTAGRRVAYHILRDAPDRAFGAYAGTMRIDAADVCHLYVCDVPGQVRGLSWLAPVLTALMQLHRLDDAMLARSNTAALFGGFVTDPNGTAAGFEGTATGGSLEGGMEPGALKVLPPGAAIEFPTVPDATGVDSFRRELLRSIAAGAGVPYELVTGDLSQVNYSSARLGLWEFRRRCDILRKTLIQPVLLDPIFRRFVALEIIAGRLPPEAADAAPTWTWPAWPAVDPVKETDADRAAVEAGFASRRQIIAARGRDPEEVDAEIAADRFRPTPRTPTPPGAPEVTA